MKRVFISFCFPPLKYPRSIQVSRLVKYFSEPIDAVICGDESGSKDFSLAPPSLEAKVRSLIRIRRSRVLEKAERLIEKIDPRILNYPDRYRFWAWRAARAALTHAKIRAGDLVVTFGQPMSDHLAGLEIKRRSGAKWVAHFSDPWVDNPFRKDHLPYQLLNRELERKVVEGADRVIFTSEETRALVMAKYPQDLAAKAFVLPHAFDSEEGGDASPPKDEVILRYLGNFYQERSPEPLFRALAEIWRKEPGALENVSVELIGSLERRMLESDSYRALPDGLVRVEKTVDYATSVQLMKSASALLVIDAPSEKSPFLPSKLIDYLGAARPVFGITPEGTSAKLIRELGGHVADPSDLAAVTRELLALISELKSGTARFDSSCAARFDARTVTREFETLTTL